MRIDIIEIDAETQIKIYEKHGVSTEEIANVLKEDEPIFEKAGGNQIMAIGLYGRYITIFFEYNEKRKEATITTAYPSSKKQVRHYKKQKK